jgi:MFS family permease
MKSWPPALRALRATNFRRYYFGQTVSQIGSWMQSVAIMWLTYRLTNSPAATGTIGFLALAPFIFTTPLAGALSDRVSRKKLLITVQVLLFILAALLTALTWQGMMTVALLGVFAFLQGCLSAVEVTTRHSFFVELVDDRADLPNAIALNSVNINGTRLVGPAIGGVVIAAFGEAACFGINAVTYLAVVIQLVRITPRAATHAPSGKSFTSDLFEGWRIAFQSSIILPLVLLVGVVSFAINPYSILMPAIAVDTFGRGAELHGIFVSAVGIGAFIGALILAQRQNVRGLSRWLLATSTMAAVGAMLFAVFSMMKNLPLAAIAMAITGMGLMGTSATVNTIIQTVVDDDKRGRVVSVYSTFFAGAAPLGHFSAGALATVIGAPQTYFVCGVICAIGAIAYAWQLKSLRAHLHVAYVARGIISQDAPPTSLSDTEGKS